VEHVVLLHKFIECWNMFLGYINLLSCGTCMYVT